MRRNPAAPATAGAPSPYATEPTPTNSTAAASPIAACTRRCRSLSTTGIVAARPPFLLFLLLAVVAVVGDSTGTMFYLAGFVGAGVLLARRQRGWAARTAAVAAAWPLPQSFRDACLAPAFADSAVSNRDSAATLPLPTTSPGGVSSSPPPKPPAGLTLSATGWGLVAVLQHAAAALTRVTLLNLLDLGTLARFCTFWINFSGLVSVFLAVITLLSHPTLNDARIAVWTVFFCWQPFMWFVGTPGLHLKHRMWGLVLPGCLVIIILCARAVLQARRRPGWRKKAPSVTTASSVERGASSPCSAFLRAVCGCPRRSCSVPAALAIATVLSGFGFFLAYWMLLSTNYFWVRAVTGDAHDGVGHVSKSGTLSELDPALTLHSSRVGSVQITNFSHVLEVIEKSGRKFPFIAKPDECTTSSRGVDVIRDAHDAHDYFLGRCEAQKERATMFQDIYHGGKEFVIFYVRFPWERSGRLKSIGSRSRMVAYDSGKTMRGGGGGGGGGHGGNDGSSPTAAPLQFKRAEYFITEKDELWTPALMAKFDEISYNVTGFYSGRVDIKTPSDEALQRGEFSIMEINFNAIGCIAEKPCCCTSFDTDAGWVHPNRRWYHNKWVNILRRVRTGTFQVFIGAANILSGDSNLWVLLTAGLPKFYAMSQQCAHHEMYFGRP